MAASPTVTPREHADPPHPPARRTGPRADRAVLRRRVGCPSRSRGRATGRRARHPHQGRAAPECRSDMRHVARVPDWQDVDGRIRPCYRRSDEDRDGLPLQRSAQMMRSCWWRSSVSAIAQADTGTLPGARCRSRRDLAPREEQQGQQTAIQDPTSTWSTSTSRTASAASQLQRSQRDARGPGSRATSTPSCRSCRVTGDEHAGRGWTGSTCDSDTSRPTMCHHVVSADIADVQSIAAKGGLTITRSRCSI